VRAVGRLSLSRLVRSTSTLELGRRHWRGRRGRRSTGGGGRWEGSLGNKGGGRLSATIVLTEGSGVEAHEGRRIGRALGGGCCEEEKKGEACRGAEKTRVG
jgi:hypothetical protein